MKGEIDLTADQRRVVLKLIERHLPDTGVWAYGSRVQWTSRSESDLDLVVFAGPDQSGQVADLREAFEESDLPFRVDVLMWQELNAPFRGEIDRDYVPLAKSTSGIPSSAEETRYSDAVTINPRIPLVRGQSYPFVTMADITSGHRCAEPGSDRPYTGSGSRFRAGDTLMARITPSLENGKVARYCAQANESEYAHGSTEFIVVRGRPGVTTDMFAYYLTSSDKVRRYAISQMTGTSGRQRVPVDALANCIVSIPDLATQRHVARALSILDDKIELNRRMNATLQDIFRTVFQHLLTSNGTGGSAGRLADLASVGGQVVDPQTLPADTPYIGLEHMPKSSIALAEWGSASDITSNKLTFCRSDLLFGKLRPYFRKAGTPPVDGVCSTDIIVVVPNRQYWHAFVLGYISSREFCSYASQQATGTKMPRTHWSVLKQYPVAIPAESSARRFQDAVGGILDLLSANIHEDLRLTELRTTLSTTFFGKLDRTHTSLSGQ